MKRYFLMYLMSGSLLLFFATTSFAQTTSSNQSQSDEYAEQPQGDESARANETSQNATYFFDQWIEGQVKMEGGTEYENVPLKFDVKRNELITKGDDGQEQVLDDVRSFTLGPPRLANLSWFKKAKYLDNFNEVPDDQFVQVIYEGKSYLLAVPGQPENDQNEASSLATHYYYISPAGEATSFTPDRESLTELLKDKEEIVTTFIEEANIDFDNVADLARLVAHYDQN